jgi:hypothetical protein
MQHHNQNSGVSAMTTSPEEVIYNACHGDTNAKLAKYHQEHVNEGNLVAILKRRLADRDVELRTLRDTMECNEQAILRVLQDRQHAWEIELADLRADWERWGQEHRQRAAHTEHSLREEIAKLERENKMLRSTVEAATQVKTSFERVGCCKQDNGMSELEWTRAAVEQLTLQVGLKCGEIAELRSRLDGCVCCADASFRLPSSGTSLHHPKTTDGRPDTVMAAATSGQQLVKDEAAVNSSSSCQTGTSTVTPCHQPCPPDNIQISNHPAVNKPFSNNDSALRLELECARAELASVQHEFQMEQDRWLREKERVIAYQKQLQMNYVQMERRNAVLEADLQQLTSELNQLRVVATGSGGKNGCVTNGSSMLNLLTKLDESSC